VDNVVEVIVEIRNKLGLHVHPSDLIAKTAVRFLSKITIEHGEAIANARSIVDLTGLEAGIGTRLKLRAEGSDAESAVQAIAKLFESKFGEE
jgi:phosphocarrier protein HPr